MNYLLKNVLAIGALVVLLPATTACSEKYLTYNHTPGEKTENPEDPGEVSGLSRSLQNQHCRQQPAASAREETAAISPLLKFSFAPFLCSQRKG